MRGVLYTGYFNGGIAKLQFLPVVEDLFDIWLGSTKPIQDLNAIDTTPFLVLSILLFLLGIASLVPLIPSLQEAFAVREEGELDAELRSQAVYASIWLTYKPADAEGKRFQPVSWNFAMHVMGLSKEELKDFLLELELKSKKDCGQYLAYIMHSLVHKQARMAEKEDAERQEVMTKILPVRMWHSIVKAIADSDDDEKDIRLADSPSNLPTAQDWRVVMLAAQHAAELHKAVPKDPDDLVAKLTLPPDVDKENEGAKDKLGIRRLDSSVRMKEARQSGAVVVDNNLYFGSTQQVETQHGNVTVAATTAEELKHFLLPIITVLQSVYVWMSTLRIPPLYHYSFRSLFSFICADLAAAFVGIPAIVTPLLQMFLGLLIIGALYFVLHDDERTFLEYLGKYVVKRDVVEGRRDAVQVADMINQKMMEEFIVARGSLHPVEVAIFPWTECEKVDIMKEKGLEKLALEVEEKKNEDSKSSALMSLLCCCKKEKTISGAEGDEELAASSTTACRKRNATRHITSNDLSFAVTMEEDADSEHLRMFIAPSSEFGEDSINNASLISDSGLVLQQQQQQRQELRTLGCRCVWHTDRRLASHVQSNIYPFADRARCCVVVGGVPCQSDCGVIYECRKKTGVDKYCGYAVCEEHYRGSALDVILSEVLAFQQSILVHGYVWLLATITLLLANALYTPVLKTAFMILGCHPYFQCTFPSCWGLPVSSGQLSDPNSHNVPSPTAVVDRRNFAIAALLSLFVVVIFGVGLPLVLTLLLRRRRLMMSHAFFSKEYGASYKAPNLDYDKVTLSEWFRFSQTDPTVLATWYRTFEYRWMGVPPILLAWKVGLLVPPVFIPQNTFGQSVGIALMEAGYGLFLILTEPSIAPVVDMMYKIGITHQMFFLAFQNLDTHYRYHGRGSLAPEMVATTSIYLLACLACILWSKIAPAILNQRHAARTEKFFRSVGMRFSGSTALYIVPSATKGIPTTESSVQQQTVEILPVEEKTMPNSSIALCDENAVVLIGAASTEANAKDDGDQQEDASGNVSKPVKDAWGLGETAADSESVESDGERTGGAEVVTE